MQPDRHASASRYWVFRGEVHGQPVAWGTSAGGWESGLAVQPIMVEPPSGFSLGPSMIPTDAPPLTATTIRIADPDGEIADLIMPDLSGQQDLSGAVYLGDGAAGTETRMTPTMQLVGNSQRSDGALDLHLEVDASRILGRPVALWTVRELLAGELDDLHIEQGARDYVLAGRTIEALWEDIVHSTSESLDSIVPWSRGAGVDLLPLSREYPRYWIVAVADTRMAEGVLFTQPPPSPDGLLSERDGVLSREREAGVEGRPVGLGVTLRVADRLGAPRKVGVWMYVMPEPPEEEPARYIFVPPASPRLSFVGPPLLSLSTWDSPAAMVARIVYEQAEAGLSGLHQQSFERAIRDTEPTFGGLCGGVLAGENVTLAEVFQHITPICNLRLWIGTDDKLHAAVPMYTYSDSQRAKDDLLELQEGDIFPRDPDGTPAIETEIVADPDDDAAAVTRVSVDWSEDQRRMFPLQTASTLPSLGGTVAGGRERILSGAWLRPDRGVATAVALQASASGDTVRVRLPTHLTVAPVAPGALIRVTHPLPLGLPGLGWERRLARVDAIEVRPEEDACVLTLTDLGPSERMRLGLLDAMENWVLFAPQSGAKLSASVFHEPAAPEFNYTFIDFGFAGASLPGAPQDYIGATVWTPGMTPQELRRSWRIISMQDGGPGIGWVGSAYPSEPVDLTPYGDPYQYYEEITATGYLLRPGWIIMRTHMQSGANYRPDFIRAGDIETGKFDDGEPAFQFSAG